MKPTGSESRGRIFMFSGSKNRGLNLRMKRNIVGYAFISPFLTGFLLFFLSPIIRSFIFSFQTLSMGPHGFDSTPAGFSHYAYAFSVDPQFRQILVGAVMEMLTNVPIIIIFSFFAATLLNQAFRGRFLARAIFFLPVILVSGIIGRIEQNDVVLQMMQDPTRDVQSFGLISFNLETILLESKLHPALVNYVFLAIDRIYQVISDSGVQILIFLAGLQSIPPSLFEASNIEGATSWENFWKITFPMVSPLILVNALYSIIDSFTKSDNQVMQFIHDKAFANAQFGYSSALSWTYMAVIIVLLAVIGLIYRRRVFYHE